MVGKSKKWVCFNLKEGIIKMMAGGELMSDEEGGDLISTCLDEVYRLLQ